MTRDQAAFPTSWLRTPPAGGGGRPSEPAPDLPCTLGDYRLDRELGRGGAGIVYEAEQLSTGRRVALKLPMGEDALDGNALARFRREGLAAGSIDHPHCVFVYDADEWQGQPYIAMELMDGGNLQELVEQVGPLDQARAVFLILQVLDGLAAAARQGVLHRDVKPSNCFLGADGSVKVGDFGLCRELLGSSDLTRSARLLGTPMYVSPEQVRGDPLDERSDQYSLGATLYFLLAGRPPIQGDHLGILLSRILRGDARRLRDVQPSVPAGLERIVMRAIACDPGDRFRSYAALRRALLAYAPGSSTRAPILRRLAALAAGAVRVVLGSLRRAGEPRAQPVSPGLGPARPCPGAPEQLGPYEVLGQLFDGRAGSVCLAEERQLRRPAWILLRDSGAAALDARRRGVHRSTRMRWLSGGVAGGRRWDAFAPPPGLPLLDVIHDGGAWSWKRASWPLVALARELRDAHADGSLPDDVALDEVWLDERTGRTCLADFGLGGASREGADDDAGAPTTATDGESRRGPSERRAQRLVVAAARGMVAGPVPAEVTESFRRIDAESGLPGGLAELVSRLLVWRSA